MRVDAFYFALKTLHACTFSTKIDKQRVKGYIFSLLRCMIFVVGRRRESVE
jgi:hypothetical protein